MCLRQHEMWIGRSESLLRKSCRQVSDRRANVYRSIYADTVSSPSLDLSWNYAAEAQAYDRVHRLGQEKDVFVKRLVVRNTIEER